MTVTITPATVARAARLARSADDYTELMAARAKITRLQAQLDVQRSDELVTDLRVELIRTDAELHDVVVQLHRADRRIRELEDRARRPRSESTSVESWPGARSRRDQWATDEEWVRHEVYLAWVERVPAAERAAFAIREFAVGACFAETLLRLDACLFAKALRAVVDVVTHRMAEVSSRHPHPLRAGDGVGRPQISRRSDNARCWRAYVEQNTAAARRIHYWIREDGTVELGRIVAHDDMRP